MDGEFRHLLKDIAFEPDPEAAVVSLELLATVLARVARLAPEPVTRAQLATGWARAPRPIDRRTLPPASMSKAIKRLIKAGLLVEGDKRRSGKRHYVQLLRLGEGYVTAACHVEMDEDRPATVTTVLCDIVGAHVLIEQFDKVPDDGPNPWAALARQIHQHVGVLIDRFAAGRVGVAPVLFGLGIELGAPVLDGMVTPIADMSTADLWPVDLEAELRQAFSADDRFPGLTIVIENDTAALAALAIRERRYALADLAVMAVFHSGIGGGLVMDGRVRRGQAGRAMEVGHLVVDCPPNWAESHTESATGPRWSGSATPAKCPCGRRGHVDGIATPARIALELAKRGSNAKAVYTFAGAALGRAISHVCNVVAPSELIVYVPAELNNAVEHSPEAEYLLAAGREIDVTFAVGVPAATVVEFKPLPDQRADIAALGARAAAVCVLDAVIEHALVAEELPETAVPPALTPAMR